MVMNFQRLLRAASRLIYNAVFNQSISLLAWKHEHKIQMILSKLYNKLKTYQVRMKILILGSHCPLFWEILVASPCMFFLWHWLEKNSKNGPWHGQLLWDTLSRLPLSPLSFCHSHWWFSIKKVSNRFQTCKTQHMMELMCITLF